MFFLVVLWVGVICMNEMLYEFYLEKGDKLKAWLIRPVYGFRMFWIK